ncbi:hypothetical protein [Paenibacillus terrae]|uniref:Uncharacterized protein n=1 Tax=Paenibacillus terrae TaxID=159743 RepID=A0A0D7WTZ1_9BACL|nr:hypothetical protein [Paenibacillus terrae]KJD42646.1 hypothetical protein QD47_27035 [Paenibacillus terrae]
MEPKWICNQELFPCINVSLMEDILGLASDSKKATLKFSKTYNLQYIGELAERWNERNIVNSNQDIIALILGISLCSSGTFLYDQKNLFINSICDYLKTNWNGIAASAILSFGYKDLKPNPELEQIRERLVQCVDSYEHESERILQISLLSHVYELKPNDELRKYVLTQIDGLCLNIKNPFLEYPLLLLLSDVYRQLERPTSKEFKTKGMGRLLQVITALRTKEVLQNQQYNTTLKVKDGDISVLNFYMAFQNTPDVHSITGPGFDRIKENFFFAQFTSENDLPMHLIDLIDEVSYGKSEKEHHLDFLLRKLKSIGLSGFPNRNNLKLLISKCDTILLKHCSKSYIELLREELFIEERRNRIIQVLLEIHALNEEQFNYLQQLSDKFKIGITPNLNYTAMCLEYGYLTLNDVEMLMEKDMIKLVISILKNKDRHEDLLNLLEKVPNEYHKFLLEDSQFNLLKTNMKDEYKVRLYPLYINVLFAYKTSKFPIILYEILQTSEFIDLFQLSTNKVDQIEQQLFTSKFLPNEIQQKIRTKYMTPEELEKEYIIELCEKVNSSTWYKYKSYAEKNWDRIAKNSDLREVFFTRFIAHAYEIADEYDLGRILIVLYQFRSKKVFAPEQIVCLENSLTEKTIKIFSK